MLLEKPQMQLNERRPFQFDEMPTLERVETTQLNANNQATKNEMIFHYLIFSKNKLMKNAFPIPNFLTGTYLLVLSNKKFSSFFKC